MSGLSYPSVRQAVAGSPSIASAAGSWFSWPSPPRWAVDAAAAARTADRRRWRRADGDRGGSGAPAMASLTPPMRSPAPDRPRSRPAMPSATATATRRMVGTSQPRSVWRNDGGGAAGGGRSAAVVGGAAAEGAGARCGGGRGRPRGWAPHRPRGARRGGRRPRRSAARGRAPWPGRRSPRGPWARRAGPAVGAAGPAGAGRGRWPPRCRPRRAPGRTASRRGRRRGCRCRCGRRPGLPSTCSGATYLAVPDHRGRAG